MRTEKGWCWLQGLAGKASQTLKERLLDCTVTTCFLPYLQGPPRMLCSLGPLLISAHIVLVDMETIDCHPLATVRDKGHVWFLQVTSTIQSLCVMLNTYFHLPRLII